MSTPYQTYQVEWVPEASTVRITGQVLDLSGGDLPGAQVDTLTATIIDAGTGAVIGLWDELDIKNANGGTLDVDGLLTLIVPAADIVLPTGARATRLKVLFTWQWGDNVGRHRLSFPVADLEQAP